MVASGSGLCTFSTSRRQSVGETRRRDNIGYLKMIGHGVMAESREEIFDDANGDLAVGDLESAVEKYRRCVEIDPEFFDRWHDVGMALMKIGRYPEAIEAGKRATELRPNDQIGWTSLSFFLQSQWRHQRSGSSWH